MENPTPTANGATSDSPKLTNPCVWQALVKTGDILEEISVVEVESSATSLKEIYEEGSDDEDVEIPMDEVTVPLTQPTLQQRGQYDDDYELESNSGSESSDSEGSWCYEGDMTVTDGTLRDSNPDKGGQLNGPLKWSDGECKPTIFQFTENPGTRVDTSTLSSPLDFLRLFITEELVQRICDETNHYASSFLKKTALPPKSRFKKWHAATKNEIWAFIGLITAMGLIRIPDLDDYWSTDELFSTFFFSTTMTRDRFHLILTFLHINNNELYIEKGQEGHDALFKLRPFLDTLREKFLSVFYPEQNLVLDEAMIAWRGNLSFKVFNPNKADKCGIKVFEVCDSDTGYCCNFEMYVGKKQSSAKGATYDLSMRLMEPFLDRGHHLYVNNYYTSPILLQDLATQNTNACGTVRPHADGLPQCIRKRGQKSVTKADDLTVMNNGVINFFKLYDRKEVRMLSTLHTGRKKAASRVDPVTGKITEKLEAILDYGKNMGSFDRTDQMIQYYSFKRRTLKWWKKVFFHFLMLAEVNAYIVYKATMKASGQRPMEYKIFRKELAKQLAVLTPTFKHNLPRKISKAVGESSLHRLTARHFPSKVQRKRKRAQMEGNNTDTVPPMTSKRIRAPSRTCIVCSGIGKRKGTTVECNPCDVGLCIVPCFGLYHTHVDFKRARRRLNEKKVQNQSDTNNEDI